MFVRSSRLVHSTLEHFIVRLRALERAKHEHVDGRRGTRYSLYFGGQGAQLSLGEDDVLGPWSAEFWVYRASAEEAARTYLRGSRALVQLFVGAYEIEQLVSSRVRQLVRCLQDGTADPAAPPPSPGL